MITEQDFKQQANIRAALMQSANQAKRGGFSPDFWKHHPEIQGAVIKFSLHKDILEHIVSFIWTFEK